MAEDAGKLEVEYIVISSSAMRKLERLQAQLEKVEKAAEHQSKIMKKSFKQAAIGMAAFGAVATGVLYSIIKSSSYAAMWMDQLKYTIMRFADKILVMTGMKEDIDDLFRAADKFLDLWEEEGITYAITVTLTDFADWWDDLSTTKKWIYGVAFAAGVLVIGLTSLSLAISWAGWVSGTAGLALSGLSIKILLVRAGALLASAGVWLLNGAIAVLTAPITLVIAAAALLAAGLLYLWSKTDIGKATIQSLINVWNNFKADISEVGWVTAITNALKGLGKTLVFNWVKEVKYVYEKFVEITGWLPPYAKEIFAKTIHWAIESIKGAIPFLIKQFTYIYNNFWTILANMKTYALDMGHKIVQALVDGIKASLGLFTEALDWLTVLWNTESNTLMVEAYDTGTKVNTALSDGISASSSMAERAAFFTGQATFDGLERGVTGAADSVCDEMDYAVLCAESGVDLMNTTMEELVTDYEIKVSSRFGTGVQWGEAGYTGEYAAGHTGTTPKGERKGDWGSANATGGHVLRTGAATIHQGEDIVNLKNIMAGAKFDKTGSKDITINNTINITSGNLNNPMEVSKVANTISKRMGEELRRISTSI